MIGAPGFFESSPSEQSGCRRNPEEDFPTDLSAAGEVEVDEIVADLFFGQAKEAFIGDPVAVG